MQCDHLFRSVRERAGFDADATPASPGVTGASTAMAETIEGGRRTYGRLLEEA